MGAFHEKLDANLVGVIEFFLSLACDGCDVVYSQLELVLFEEVEEIFVDEALGKELEHL